MDHSLSLSDSTLTSPASSFTRMPGMGTGMHTGMGTGTGTGRPTSMPMPSSSVMSTRVGVGITDTNTKTAIAVGATLGGVMLLALFGGLLYYRRFVARQQFLIDKSRISSDLEPIHINAPPVLLVTNNPPGNPQKSPSFPQVEPQGMPNDSTVQVRSERPSDVKDGMEVNSEKLSNKSPASQNFNTPPPPY